MEIDEFVIGYRKWLDGRRGADHDFVFRHIWGLSRFQTASELLDDVKKENIASKEDESG